MKGWVYLIRNKDLYKIGITQNLPQRIKQLKPDSIVCTLETDDFVSIEKALHKKYKDVRIPQTEYFRLTQSQLLECKRIFSFQKHPIQNFLKNIINKVIFLGCVFLFIEFCFLAFTFLSRREFRLYELEEDIFGALVWTGILSWVLSLRVFFLRSKNHIFASKEIKDKLSKSIILLVCGFLLIFSQQGFQLIKDLLS